MGQAPENVEPHGAATTAFNGSALRCPPAVLPERLASSAQFQELFDSVASSVSKERGKEDKLECVTVVIPSEEVGNAVLVEEAVEEVVTTELPMEDDEEVHMVHPSSPLSDTENMKNDPYSDYGYESLDSPHSDISSDTSMTCMWTDNFSNLFPNLV